MDRRQRLLLLVLGVIVLALAAALYQQITYHYQRGDFVARYSTFREDPMGASVLYDSLSALPELRVDRNTRGLLPELEDPRQTLVYLGARIHADPVSFLEETEAFVEAGGRLVVAHSAWSYWDLHEPYWNGDTFWPQFPEEAEAEEEAEEMEAIDDAEDVEEAADADPDSDAAECEDEDAEPDAPTYQDISERWGFDYGYVGARDTDADMLPEYGYVDEIDIFHRASVRRVGDTDTNESLPSTLPWRSRVYFQDYEAEWDAHYVMDEGAVVLQRRMGDGEILLLSDSYVFSNEGLKYDPRLEFVAWALGGHPTIMFNETHLGGRIQGNVMTLVRRYRLTGFLVAFVFIGLLYVWKSTVSLLPRRPALEAARLTRVDTYHDATATLSHLLRRGLSYRQLLHTAYDEWKKSRGVHQDIAPDRAEDIRRCLTLNPHQDYGAKLGAHTRYAREALEKYNALVRILRQLEKGRGRTALHEARLTTPSKADNGGHGRDHSTPPVTPKPPEAAKLSGKERE